MGQFEPSYLAHQVVFAAYLRGKPIAFVSFHTTGGMWTLDLVRHGTGLPKGTMQALICAAIDAAKTNRIKQLSLAAVPSPAPHLPFAKRALAASEGLHRFKSAFGPQWVPRYLCARGPIRLTLAAIALTYGIQRPGPVRPKGPANPPQILDEENSFASGPAPCEAPLST